MNKSKTSVKAILLGMAGMLVGVILAISVYVFLAMLNRYTPYLMVFIYFMPFTGYIVIIQKIKEREKELAGELPESYEKVNTKNYVKNMDNIMTKIEIAIGFIFSIVLGFFGVYFAEVLNLTYLICKDTKDKGVQIPVSEIFKYSLAGVFEEPATKGYIYWSWGLAMVALILFGGLLIFAKIKNKNNRETDK